MSWHSFITSPYERRKRKKNMDENLEDIREEEA